jgi:AcrR family transcriptional regulator|tara:strand:- start:2669 stop:3373 length:705 start_codon:yes stop_codon:yes gene_type:complete
LARSADTAGEESTLMAKQAGTKATTAEVARAEAGEETGPEATGAGPSDRDPTTVAILDAATRLLAGSGVSGFTTDALAAEARVSKSTIYNRWSTKNEIFVALVDHAVGPAKVDDLGSLEAEIEDWFVDRISVYATPGFRRITASLIEVASHDRDVDRAMGRTQTHDHNTIMQIIERAQRRGEVDPTWDVGMLKEFLLGPITYRLLLDGASMDGVVIEAFRRLAVTALKQTPPPA